MRVTFPTVYQNNLTNIRNKQEAMSRYSSQVADGKRLSTPQDEPLGWFKGMSLKNELREVESFKKNLEFAEGWNRAAENALSQVSDLLNRANELGIAANRPNSEEEKNAYVQELDQIIQEMVHTANAKYNDRYVFGGAENSASNAPFEMSLNPDTAEVESVSGYLGEDTALKVRVGKERLETISIEGKDVFFKDSDPDSLFNHLLEIKSAVATDDKEKLGAQLQKISEAQAHLSKNTTLVGTRLARFENQKEVMDTVRLQHQEELSLVEDVDTPEAILHLQQTRTAFEATLRVTAMVDQLNLTKFI